MRLLQLATGPDELIDLHPNVTVVTELGPDARQLLAEVVAALAEGVTGSHVGLLEAHGVLFDLAPEALALLDIVPGAVQPVVTADDLPAVRPAPPVDEPPPEEQAQALADIEARHALAEEAHTEAQADLAAAVEEVERIWTAIDDAASEAVAPVEVPDTAEAAELRPDCTAGDQPQVDAELIGLEDALRDAVAARADAESAAEAARLRSHDAAVHASTIAASLETARQATDPEAAASLAAATLVLTEAETALDSERQPVDAAPPDDDEPPADRVARLGDEIGALEKRLAAFGPVDVAAVAACLERMRSPGGGAVLAPMPEAEAIADELAALEAQLVSTEAIGGTPGGGMAAVRARLEEAHQALLEADQAARHPELDRDAVDRLEHVHASLLEAIDKADGRFGGARAQRRVEALRREENALLDQLRLASYSEYMMGNLLLHVDPEKEAALDAARSELASAEDQWRSAEAETDAELTRAEQMERRRVLIDEARALVGHPVTSASVIDELRALRVEAEPSDDDASALRQALDDAGVAVGDEALDREELLLLADAWVAEAGDASDREQALRAELERLQAERVQVSSALDGGGGGAGPALTVDEPGAAVAVARDRLREAEDRHQAHLDAEGETLALAGELAVATEAERDAADAAAEADATLIADARQEEQARAAHARREAELGTAAGDDRPGVAGELSAALALAEAIRAGAASRAQAAAELLEALRAERRQAEAAMAAAEQAAAASRPATLAEEVEWYLLARLATQRSVSLAGSLPLLLDDALMGLEDAAVEHVLGRLERMAEAVQVIVVTDDPVVASWAARTGADRAAVVRPLPASMVPR